jgi:hypothetical protein
LTLDQVVERIRREYAALPGLHLTEPQVRRLWGLDPSDSRSALRRLVDGEFLARTVNGEYVRADVRRGLEKAAGSH